MSHSVSEMDNPASPPREELPDATLVAQSLGGDREAFSQIVARHQSLVCSVAYSAVGHVAQSEDIAQETFVTAWRQLPRLEEPAKLRGWLCGIARNLAQNSRRRQSREPSHAAETIDLADTFASPEPSPSHQAMQRDEESILWRALQEVPEIYREPLVLFYRQEQSVRNVAEALELSEEVVRQRLSRGRKLLQEQVLAMVEGALARTNPTFAFTAGVMAAIPVVAANVGKAAFVAATAVKGATTAKTAGLGGALGIFLGPLLGVFSGLEGARTGLNFMRSQPATAVEVLPSAQAASREEWETRMEEWRKKSRARRLASKDATKQMWSGWGKLLVKPLAATLLCAGLLVGLASALPERNDDIPNYRAHPYLAVLGLALIGLTLASALWLIRAYIQYHREYRAPFWKQLQERLRQPGYWKKPIAGGLIIFMLFALTAGIVLVPLRYFADNPVLLTVTVVGFLMALPGLNRTILGLIHWSDPEFPQPPTQAPKSVFRELCGKSTLLGIPLYHVNFGRDATGRRKVAKAWIAIGSQAVGFFALGGAAVGVIAIGPAAVGVVAFGGLAIGPVALGCLSLGYWAAGGIAIGIVATGGLAVGWHMASGELALAHDVAAGTSAFAPHANDQAAQAAVAGEGFFSQVNRLVYGAWIFLGILGLFIIEVYREGKRNRQKPTPESVVEFPSPAPSAPADLATWVKDEPEPSKRLEWEVWILLGGGILIAYWAFAPESWQPEWVFATTVGIAALAMLTYDAITAARAATEHKLRWALLGAGKCALGIAVFLALCYLGKDNWQILLGVLTVYLAALKFGPGERFGITTAWRWKYALKTAELLALAILASTTSSRHFGIFVLGLMASSFCFGFFFQEKYKEIKAWENPAAKEPTPAGAAD